MIDYSPKNVIVPGISPMGSTNFRGPIIPIYTPRPIIAAVPNNELDESINNKMDNMLNNLKHKINANSTKMINPSSELSKLSLSLETQDSPPKDNDQPTKKKFNLNIDLINSQPVNANSQHDSNLTTINVATPQNLFANISPNAKTMNIKTEILSSPKSLFTPHARKNSFQEVKGRENN